MNVNWDDIQPAKPVVRLPADDYECTVSRLSPHRANTGSEGYEVTFEVAEGQYKGAALPPHYIWTKGANIKDTTRPYAKRDLQFLGFRDWDTIPPLPIGRYVVTLTHEADNVRGKIYTFNPKA